MHTFEGKIVSITESMLMMTSKSGQEHTQTVTTETAFTRNGAACAAEDIKTGSRIRVTTKAGDRTLVTRVDVIEK